MAHSVLNVGTKDSFVFAGDSQLLAQATTESEEEQVKDRMAYLRERESEIQTAFQRKPNLANGLVTLSRTKQCVAVLTESLETAHRLGASDFRENFPDSPSRFIVFFTIQQLRTSEPPIQQLPTVSAIELEQYALIFQQSFVNTWLFNERLKQFWS